jgi:hypothetical protein
MDELLTPEELPAGQLAESLENGQLYAEVGRRWVMSVQNVQPAQELFQNNKPRPGGVTALSRCRRRHEPNHVL